MVLGNRRGGITPAEGCMFGAVVLFVLLLIGMLYIGFMRFRDPPQPSPAPPPIAARGTAYSPQPILPNWNSILPAMPDA